MSLIPVTNRHGPQNVTVETTYHSATISWHPAYDEGHPVHHLLWSVLSSAPLPSSALLSSFPSLSSMLLWSLLCPVILPLLIVRFSVIYTSSSLLYHLFILFQPCSVYFGTSSPSPIDLFPLPHLPVSSSLRPLILPSDSSSSSSSFSPLLSTFPPRIFSPYPPLPSLFPLRFSHSPLAPHLSLYISEGTGIAVQSSKMDFWHRLIASDVCMLFKYNFPRGRIFLHSKSLALSGSKVCDWCHRPVPMSATDCCCCCCWRRRQLILLHWWQRNPRDILRREQ